MSEREAAQAAEKAETERQEALASQRLAENRAQTLRVRMHGDAIREILRHEIAAHNESSAGVQHALDTIPKITDRDWEEFEERASGTIENVRGALTVMLHKALDREAEERRKAEVQRIRDAQAQAASAQAQRDLDAKIAAEQAAAKVRSENVAHRRKINREALTAVLKIIQAASSEFQPGDESLAQAIIEAVAKGEIPHMKMEY